MTHSDHFMSSRAVHFLLSVPRLLWSTHSFHFHFISSLTLSRTAPLLLLFSLMSVSSIVLSSVCFHLYRSRYAIRGLNNFVSFWFCVNAHMHRYKGIHTETDAQKHLICSILSFYIYSSSLIKWNMVSSSFVWICWQLKNPDKHWFIQVWQCRIRQLTAFSSYRRFHTLGLYLL